MLSPYLGVKLTACMVWCILSHHIGARQWFCSYVGFSGYGLTGLSSYDRVFDMNCNDFGLLDDLALFIADLCLQSVLATVRTADLE